MSFYFFGKTTKIRSNDNFSLRNEAMLESLGWPFLNYIILGVLGSSGLLFCGIMLAAYASGMARDRSRDRAKELSATFDTDIEQE